MGAVPNTEPVPRVGVHWYLREKRGRSGRTYIYLVKVVCENGKCRQQNIGNVEAIEQVMMKHKKSGPRPYAKNRGNGGPAPVVRPPGFEPGIAGLGGRRPSPG